MKTSKIFTAVAAAMTLAAGSALATGAATAPAADSSAPAMEKCMVVSKDGKGMILAGKNDCKTDLHSCGGSGKGGDAMDWINVPMGECAKINAGDFSGVSADIKAKIDGAK